MASEIYTTIGDAGRGEYEEKRSLFIGQAVHAENEEQAMVHVRGVRAQYHDARHHVFAYVLRGGALCEAGTFDGLMAQKGYFYSLFNVSQ
mgnify:CR=1 FL=1